MAQGQLAELGTWVLLRWALISDTPPSLHMACWFTIPDPPAASGLRGQH